VKKKVRRYFGAKDENRIECEREGGENLQEEEKAMGKKKSQQTSTPVRKRQERTHSVYLLNRL